MADYYTANDAPSGRGLPPPPSSAAHSRSQSRQSHRSQQQQHSRHGSRHHAHQQSHGRDRSMSRSHSHHSHHSQSHSRSRSSRSRSQSRTRHEQDAGQFDPHLQKRLSAQLNSNKNRKSMGSTPLMPAEMMSNLHLKQQPSQSDHRKQQHVHSSSGHNAHGSHVSRDHLSGAHGAQGAHGVHAHHGSQRSRSHSRSSRSHRSALDQHDRSRSMSRSQSGSRASRASSMHGGMPPPFDRVHTASMSHGNGVKNFAPQAGAGAGAAGAASHHHAYRSSYNGGYQVNGSLYDGKGNVPQMGMINSGVQMQGQQHPQMVRVQIAAVPVQAGGQPKDAKGAGAGKWFVWGVICLIIAIVCFLSLGDGSDMHESRDNGGMLIVGALLALLCMVVGFVQGCQAMRKENEMNA